MASPAPAASPTLCRGGNIGYKAFARKLTPDADVAVLILVATCSFDNSGFTISFQPADNGFQLLQQPPTGIVREMVTYCTASWASVGLEVPPGHVTVTDGFGSHRVHVKEW